LSNWVRYRFEHLRKLREYALKVVGLPGTFWEIVRLYVEILEEAIDSYGLPWDAPIELHKVEEKDVERYVKCLGKMIKVKTS